MEAVGTKDMISEKVVKSAIVWCLYSEKCFSISDYSNLKLMLSFDADL